MPLTGTKNVIRMASKMFPFATCVFYFDNSLTLAKHFREKGRCIGMVLQTRQCCPGARLLCGI